MKSCECIFMSLQEIKIVSTSYLSTVKFLSAFISLSAISMDAVIGTKISWWTDVFICLSILFVCSSFSSRLYAVISVKLMTEQS